MASNPNTKPDPFNAIEKHSKYFIRDGDLYLLAGKTLFCVHSFFLKRDSSKFREMLVAPVAPTVTRAGSSEGNPIVLAEATSAADFDKFLWLIYNETYSDYTATLDEWTSILRVACQYDFTEAKHCAIRGLQTCDLSVVDRLFIYRLYQVDIVYLIPLYAKLCARDHSLNDEEINKLGQETALLIFRLRERVRSTSQNGNKSPLPAGVDAFVSICRILKVDPKKVPDFHGHGSVTFKLQFRSDID